MHLIGANQSHSSAGFLISRDFWLKKPSFLWKLGFFMLWNDSIILKSGKKAPNWRTNISGFIFFIYMKSQTKWLIDEFKNRAGVITRLDELFLDLNAVLLTNKESVSVIFLIKKSPTLGKAGHIKQKLSLWRIRSCSHYFNVVWSDRWIM